MAYLRLNLTFLLLILIGLSLAFPSPSPEYSSILVQYEKWGYNGSHHISGPNTWVINVEGKLCSRTPERFPLPISSASGGFVGDTIIICGGIGYPPDYLQSKECYSLKKNESWKKLNDLNQIKSSASSIVMDDSLYMIGGSGSCEHNQSSSESISKDGVVTQEPNYPFCVDDHSTVAINDTTSMTIGGSWTVEIPGKEFPHNFNTTYYKSTYFFNHNDKKFVEGPDLLVARSYAAAGLLKDHVTNDEFVVVVGGYSENSSGLINNVELLKLGGTNVWKQGKPFPMDIHSTSVVSIGGNIVVVGGAVGGADSPKNLYQLACFDGDCQWTELPQRLNENSYTSDIVAIAIPDDFFDCQDFSEQYP